MMAMIENQSAQESCIVCERTDRVGIHICNQLICDECQREIVSTDVDDDQYKYFVQRLAKLEVKRDNVIETVGSRCH
ncbi:sigma factor G inhibitor Gin [Tuberibacillus sp. Marseille-P3662]|uniref:sigma factor G inhibitor Gin n=1 Tax=Tuberibacillus sp. Marseille-P3662 TaxID=1965358 RepID=UPI000A1CE551|nr:sigma factor G inhibitor Gin [Tuberibacillus sp. Marseille-P3662]